ncbi:MAG: hybrid sensor histidine kinase/response regulator, partial [Campylobacteraceae bacterium]|nr:hybrid sensor histidine kinase/response regulator [Campylobacteraceae bacterium]
KLKNRTLKYYLSAYPKICQHLSLSLNKNIYPFEIIGDNDVFVPDTFKPFINSLVHVFRNCCDHGIEKKEMRILLNKNEVGTISCVFKKKLNFLFIKVLDDGCGININTIKEKIVQSKLNTKEVLDTLSKDEILNYIFDVHFSTKEITSEVSGRGVGLSAVKIELEKLDGKIEIDTEINKGTTFIFKIPLIGL